jgi:D-beta-D-heptose 7-phosphate kinase/D-beta-D-heptose 1-phosphate adenosyltransferase
MLSKALSMIAPRTILVVGDLILDRYTFGLSRRISPEAPVPVVLVDREEAKAGGAGNVALNLVSMGMKPRLLSRVGNDQTGRHLVMLLAEEGVDTSGVVEEEGFLTPTKTRIIASSQQLVRIDRETTQPISQACEQQLIASLPDLFEGVDLVAISDYAKGTLSFSLLRAIIGYAKEHNIRCITDPKGTDFCKYSGSTILKPNASETLRAAPYHARASLEEAAMALFRCVSVDVLMVTRSEEGISLFYPEGRHELFPVQAKEVRDVTGAGDTVLAMLSASYASGVPLGEAVGLSNVAASCAVERLGCARVSLQEVASLLIEQNPSGKICSSDVFFSLKDAFRRERLLIIRIPGCCTLSSEQLVRLSEMAHRYPDRRAVACFEGASPDPRLLELVASIGSMHLVVHGVHAHSIEQHAFEDPIVVDL